MPVREECPSSLLRRSSSIITDAVIACVVSSSSSLSSSSSAVRPRSSAFSPPRGLERCISIRPVVSFRCHSPKPGYTITYALARARNWEEKGKKFRVRNRCGERRESRMMQGGVRNDGGQRGGGIRKVAKRSVALDCLSMKLIREKMIAQTSLVCLRQSRPILWQRSGVETRNLFPINSLNNRRLWEEHLKICIGLRVRD